MTRTVPWWVPWVAVALVGVLGYALGRWGTVPEVEVRTEYRTEWRTRVETQEVVHWRDRVVERRVVDRRVEWTDAGVTTQEHVVEIVHSDAEGGSSKDQVEETAGRSEAVTATRPVLPDWRVGVDVGASLRDPVVEIYGPLVVGARVDRRVAGPVWIGAWAGTHGAAGISLSGEF